MTPVRSQAISRLLAMDLQCRTRHARRALSGRLCPLDLAGDMLQRAYDLPDRLGSDAGIERRGIELGVPEQS